jgi:hypothetical protein
MRAILKHASAYVLIIAGLSGYSSAAVAQAAAATAAIPATAADIKAGAEVRDSKGVQVAKIVEMQGANVVLDTGQAKVAIPMTFLVKDSQGVMLNITADQFNSAIAKAHARAEAAKAQQPPVAEQAQQPQQQTTPPKH